MTQDSDVRLMPIPTPWPARERPANPLRLRLEPGGLVIVCRREEVVVGRHSSCDLRLPLPDVSRKHCRLFRANGRWHITDLDSLNGVLVNQQKVKEAPLRLGDRLRIGGFTFVVEDLGHSQQETTQTAIKPQDGKLRSIARSLNTPEPDMISRRVS